MNIKILGAHSCGTQSAKLTSLLIDDVLALDAGSLSSSLPMSALTKIEAFLLTHQHHDHISDIPNIARRLLARENAGSARNTMRIYSIPAVYDAMSNYLVKGKIMDDFFRIPEENPVMEFNKIEPNAAQKVAGYDILALPVHHTVPAVGYRVTSPDGKTVFYTGDTGPGLSGCWEHVAPDLLIIEVSIPSKYEEVARQLKHLTPDTLREELVRFRELKGYLPQVVTVHMTPDMEEEITTEIAAINRSLNNAVTPGYEGMEIDL